MKPTLKTYDGRAFHTRVNVADRVSVAALWT